MTQAFKRRKHLINPRLQLRMIATFLGLMFLALTTQALFFFSYVSKVAAENLAVDGDRLAVMLPELLVWSLLLSVLVVVPVTLLIGIRTTFRWAGPLYRFEKHFESVAAGGYDETCRIRTNDELQELCAKLNAAIKKAREEGLLDDEDVVETKQAA